MMEESELYRMARLYMDQTGQDGMSLVELMMLQEAIASTNIDRGDIGTHVVDDPDEDGTGGAYTK
jgi:hypothetical protein